jgi:hypothetical protein
MSDLTSLAIVLVLALGGGGLQLWIWSVAEARLRRWAQGRGLTMLQARKSFFRTGPFPWHEARSRTIFRFRARDRGGGIREGWASCGVGQLCGEPVQVKWVEEPRSSGGPM